MGRGSAAPVFLTVLLLSGQSRAYSYQSAATPGCHETISEEALRRVRQKTPAAQPLAGSPEDAVIAGELPFDTDDDMRDIGAVALLLGVRDNDLKGRDGLDATNLALVAADPRNQREHCLRMEEHDEVSSGSTELSGSEKALSDCRSYIRQTVDWAIDQGLGPDGLPDPTKRTALPAFFAFSGAETVSVPIFYAYAGQALHALEDSFTHTFRTKDARRVTVVLNWVDYANGDLDERRDGPPHMTELDRCDDPDSLRATRRQLAIEASADLLLAALDPKLDRDAKRTALDAVLSRYLTYEPGCTYDNRWCDAPENAYRDTSCSCRNVGATAGETEPCWALCLLALTPFLRRKCRQ